MRVRYFIGPDASVEVTDRGLAYGDGLFETIAVRHGQIQRLRLHMERLSLGGTRLQLPLPDPADLEQRLQALAEPLGDGVLKLIVTRGVGPRGYAPPVEPVPHVFMFSGSTSQAPATAIDAVMLSQRLGENSELAGIKHLCRLEQVLGQLELAKGRAEEGIMSSSGGNVIGGTSRNLFVVRGSSVITPELSRAGIRGVMRQAVLTACAQLGIPATEAAMSPAELHEADEIFMTNALVGVQSVRTLDGRPLAAQDVACELRKVLGFGNG